MKNWRHIVFQFPPRIKVPKICCTSPTFFCLLGTNAFSSAPLPYTSQTTFRVYCVLLPDLMLTNRQIGEAAPTQQPGIGNLWYAHYADCSFCLNHNNGTMGRAKLCFRSKLYSCVLDPLQLWQQRNGTPFHCRIWNEIGRQLPLSHQ